MYLYNVFNLLISQNGDFMYNKKDIKKYSKEMKDIFLKKEKNNVENEENEQKKILKEIRSIGLKYVTCFDPKKKMEYTKRLTFLLDKSLKKGYISKNDYDKHKKMLVKSAGGFDSMVKDFENSKTGRYILDIVRKIKGGRK